MDPLLEANTRMAQSAFLEMRQKRFGIKSCSSPLPDAGRLLSLIDLYKDQKERVDAGLLETQGCTLTALSERLCSL